MFRPGPLIPGAFYARDADLVARDLLGQLLVDGAVALRITEVEAYGGPEDSASHARMGQTPRNQIMWGPGGHAYLYLCYGIHWMLNVVAGPLGQSSAVLIRACEPIAGLDTLLARRRKSRVAPDLLAGPGRVAQALALNGEFNGLALFRPGQLELRRGTPPDSIVAGPRVGIGYATTEDQSALRRFATGASRWVSRPKLC